MPRLCFVFGRCLFNGPTRICLIIYGLSFLGVFPLLLKDMRYSLYYRNPLNKQSEMDYHIRQNDLRDAVASEFWSSYLQNTSKPLGFKKEKNDVDIDVMLITTSRSGRILKGNNPKFLTQILWQFLRILNDTKTGVLPWTINLSICNVDSKPHEEASSFSSVVRYFQRYSGKSEDQPQINVKEKEKQDYAFCLEQSLKSNPRFSLLVEDDAFPHPQLFSILYYLLEIRKNAMASRMHSSRHDVLYYKLYHPERLQGFWSLQPERIPELISFGLLFGTCTALVINYISSNREPRTRTVYAVWLCMIVYFILTAIVISRQHLIEIRYLSKSLFSVGPTPSCCTPGMLFVADKAQHWLQYMKNHTCSLRYGKDIMLDHYRNEFYLKGLIVQPNLFVHIGFFSSLSEKMLDPSLMYYPRWFKLF